MSRDAFGTHYHESKEIVLMINYDRGSIGFRNCRECGAMVNEGSLETHVQFHRRLVTEAS